jgi:hypothetical protein
MLRNFGMSPTGEGLKEHEQITGAIALIFIILPLRMTWFHWQGVTSIRMKFAWTLIEADDWQPGLERLSI